MTTASSTAPSRAASCATYASASRTGTSRRTSTLRSLTWDEVRRWRLARSHLLEPVADAVEVARDVCGIQAQVAAAAELALSARLTGLTVEDVRAELWEKRRLVKTWTIRGTLHLHPADELALWTAARRTVSRGWYEGYGLDREGGERVLQAVADALDGRRLLREELADEVARRVGPAFRDRMASGWGYVLGDAACAGVLCFGPPKGARVTFVRPDQWLGPQIEVDPPVALEQVCRRYLRAYGPARPRDFCEWFGQLKPPEGRALFDSLAGELEEVEVEGHGAWLLAGDALNTPEGKSVRLTPEYDAYVMGFRERERLVPESVRTRLHEHPRGRYEGPAGVPFLLVDGVAAGFWRRQRKGKRVELAIEPVEPLDADERRRVDEETERVGRFLGADVRVAAT